MLKLKTNPKEHSNTYLQRFKINVEKFYTDSNIRIAFPQLNFHEIFDEEIGAVFSKLKFVKGIETRDHVRTLMLERDGFNKDEKIYEVRNNASKTNLYKLSLNVFQYGLSKYESAVIELKKISFFQNQITLADRPYRLTCLYYLMTELLRNQRHEEVITLLTNELKSYTKVNLVDQYEISSYLFGISDSMFEANCIKDLLIICNDVNLITFHKTEIVRMVSFLYLKNNDLEKAKDYYAILQENLKSVKGNVRITCLKNSNILNKMLEGDIEIELTQFIPLNSKFKKINQKLLVETSKLTFLNQSANEHRLSAFTTNFINYTLNQLFFSNLSQEKLDRYNRTLNLQWAIDIKNQLPS
jgi:hypothetical protein